MALVSASWGQLTWDTARGVLIVTLTAQDTPQPPPDGNGFFYSAPVGSQLTMELPIRKATTDPPTTIRVETTPQGAIYTRYTWSGTGWVNPVRINADGSLWTGV